MYASKLYWDSLEGDALLAQLPSFGNNITIAVIDPYPLLDVPGYDTIYRVIALAGSRQRASDHPCLFDAGDRVFLWMNPREEEPGNTKSPFPWAFPFGCFPWDEDDDDLDFDEDEDDFDEDDYDPDFDDDD